MAWKQREALKVERVPFQFRLDPSKSEFEAGRFSGIASVFGSVVDTFPVRTKFQKGAFLKTINDRSSRIKILSVHDQDSIWIGLPTRLQETEEGLLVEASLNNTERGRDVAEALRHAASLGKLESVELSVGFDPINFVMDEDEEDKEIFRVITEARLWEISVVNFGADRQTRIFEAARLDMERQLLPKNSLDSLLLTAEHSIENIEVLTTETPSDGGDGHVEVTEKQHQRLQNIHERVGRILSVKAEPPQEALTENYDKLRDVWALELAEAEAVFAGAN